MLARLESAGVIPQCVCIPYIHDLLVVCRKEWQSDTLSLYQLSTEADRFSITFCVTIMRDLTYTEGVVLNLRGIYHGSPQFS